MKDVWTQSQAEREDEVKPAPGSPPWRRSQKLERCVYAARTPGIDSKPPGAGRKLWERFSLEAPRESQSCQHLDSRLVASRTMRKPIPIVLSHPVRGSLFLPSRETNLLSHQLIAIPCLAVLLTPAQGFPRPEPWLPTPGPPCPGVQSG